MVRPIKGRDSDAASFACRMVPGSGCDGSIACLSCMRNDDGTWDGPCTLSLVVVVDHDDGGGGH